MGTRKNNRVMRLLLAGLVAVSIALSPVMPAASPAFAASDEEPSTAAEATAAPSTTDEAAVADTEGPASAAEQDDAVSNAAQAEDGDATVATSASTVLLSVPAPPSSTVTSGCFLQSSPNTRYTTLAAAIAAAQDGDVIYVVSNTVSAGTSSITCDKSLTITSVAAAHTVQVPYNFSLTQVAGTLALESVTFETKYDSLITHKRTAPLFTLKGGELVLGADASIFYQNIDAMLVYSSTAGGLTSPVRVESGGAFTMQDGASITSRNDFPIPSASKPVEGAAVFVAADGSMDMQGGTISGFAKSNATLQGAAISNKGTLTISGGTIENCTASLGGAVCNAGAATITGGTIQNCTATTEAAGAIFNAGALTLDGATIKDCKAAKSNGGAISSSAPLTVRNSTFTGNSAKNGGAIFISTADASLALSDSALSSNTAADAGSAICAAASSALTFAGEVQITGNTVTNFSLEAAQDAKDCAVAATDMNNRPTLSLSGTINIEDNTGKGGVGANLSARYDITVSQALDTSSCISIHDGGANAYAPSTQVATLAAGVPPTPEQVQLFYADGGNSTTKRDDAGTHVIWAGMCRIKWDGNSANGSGQYPATGWKYYGSLKDAIADIGQDEREKTIEILVDHYEIRESADFITYTIPSKTYVRITTSSTDEFNVKTCTFAFPDNGSAARGTTTKDSPYCIFKVSYGAKLTLDGTNGTDSSDANGLVFCGGAEGNADSMKKADALQQVVVKSEGICVLDDVTITGFNSRCDSNSNRVYGPVTSYALETGNTDMDKHSLTLTGTTLIEHIKMFGGSVHEIAGGVGVFGGAFQIDEGVVIDDCYGPTGGLALAGGATGTFSGTIQNCSTLGDNDITSLANQNGGGIFMSNDKPKVSGTTTLTVKGGKILNCVGNTDTPGVTSSAGGICVYGGAVLIDGITITGCSTNSKHYNGGGAMAFNTASDAKTSLSMQGLCIVKDNTSGHAGGDRNINLSSDTSSALYHTLYINVTGDMDPNSDVHVWAQYAGATTTTKRNVVNAPFAYADGGDASELANLNTFVNDYDSTLRGVASYDGWTSSLNQSSAYPAAIIWGTYTTVKVTKKVSAEGDDSLSTARFTFKATSSAQGFKGRVFSKDGTEIDSLVTAYPEDKEGDDSTFTLADGDYVLFENIPVDASDSALSQITITEIDGTVFASALAPFGATVSEARGLGITGTSHDGYPYWSRAAGETQACDVTFENVLRASKFKVSKDVSGSYANLDYAFTFTLTLYRPDGYQDLVAPATGYRAAVYNEDGSPSGTTYAFTFDTAATFKLSDGQYLLFDKLPVGTTYELTEHGEEGYKAGADVTSLNEGGEVLHEHLESDKTGDDLVMSNGRSKQGVCTIAYSQDGSLVNTASVINEMGDLAPFTGLSDDVDSWGVWLAVAAATVAVAAGGTLAWRRRHAQA